MTHVTDLQNALLPSEGAARIYHLNQDGLEFEFYNDGSMTARVRRVDESPRPIARLYFEDTGRPWIPKHRTWNRIIKDLIRGGDLDDLFALRDAHSQRKAALSREAPALLSSLESILAIVNASEGVSGWHLNGDVAMWGEFEAIERAQEIVARIPEKPQGVRHD